MDWADGRNIGLGGLEQTGRTLGRTGWTGGRGGLANRADRADYIILDGADLAEYRTGWTGTDGANWNGWGELVDWWTGRTRADGVDWWIGGLADGADWGGRSGLGWTRRTRADGADGGGRSGGEGMGRIGKPGAGVLADWVDRLGCARLG